jgi:hypothetical protein
MTQNSLIGSTIITVYKKDASYFSKMSSPSILTVNTEISKRLEKSNKHDLQSNNLNHAFVPKPEFERYRNYLKKRYEDHKNTLVVNEHLMPDHPSTFMKMIKGRGMKCQMQMTRDVKY